ncbi:hypothetical protein ACFVFS_23705 [Kitasatospora sp. NPDC057692]|uniref:hypothetical protein n=1 Tax=Kitasatospora sp. NPDC057692 TaxID=3346215 RepID=UPI003682C697
MSVRHGGVRRSAGSSRGRFSAVAAAGVFLLAVGGGAPQAFAAQAGGGQLTQAQSAALKAESARYLNLPGAKQVAPNKIEFDGGEVLVAIPGEANPRSLGGTKAAAVDHCLDPGQPMYNGWFCAYEKDDFQGTEVQWYKCGTYPVDFATHHGSWSNNQHKGRQARMYDKNGKLIYTTPPAYSSDNRGNWWPVWTVKPC